VQRFAEVLLDAPITHLELDLCRPPVLGDRGIKTTSVIQYSKEPWNLLDRELEFTFHLRPGSMLEVSLQLYLNVTDHWRLFCYAKSGMLLSVNLTLLRQRGSILSLSQTIKLVSRADKPRVRQARTVQLLRALTQLGLEVDDGRLILGTFDARAGKFLDTTARAFVRDFVLAAVIKGHFMGNKGYTLPGVSTVGAPAVLPAGNRRGRGRAIPSGLRYQVLERWRRCRLCGRGPDAGVRLHVDHITPYSQGGRTEERNLQVLCHQCNLGKGNRSARRFR
jgi:hypothetical protein